TRLCQCFHPPCATRLCQCSVIRVPLASASAPSFVCHWLCQCFRHPCATRLCQCQELGERIHPLTLAEPMARGSNARAMPLAEGESRGDGSGPAFKSFFTPKGDRLSAQHVAKTPHPASRCDANR